MKKYIKIAFAILIILSILLIANSSFATGIDYHSYEPSAPTGYNRATNIAGNVLSIIRNIGVIVAVVGLSIIGVRYMFGSVEQKAEYKKTLVPFAVGLIILAASVTFVKIIADVTLNATSDTKQIQVPAITNQSKYLEGKYNGQEKGREHGLREYEVGDNTLLQKEYDNAMEEYHNATNSLQKEYWRGYIDGLKQEM